MIHFALKFLTFLSLLSLIQCTQKHSPSDSTVNSLLDANIPHLDPIHSTNKYSSTINASIFEGLYHYNYFKRPLVVEPQLAEKLPDISDDGMTYTIAIKKGVFFQDDPAFKNGRGRELTAKDFIYSWKRLADPHNKALGWWVFDGLIAGLNEWRSALHQGKVSYRSTIAGLTALNSHTLQIKLTRPSFQFLHYLAMPVTMVVAQEVVDQYGKEISNHPIGTGPFRLEKWVRNSEVELSKNKNYRDNFFTNPSDNKIKHKLPLAERVVVKILVERQSEWLSFLKGKIDHGIIPKDNYNQVYKDGKLTKEYRDKGIQILKQPRPDVTFVSFNMEHPILGQNKKLRQAFSAAIDRKEMLKLFYNKRGLIAQSVIPPGLDAYDPDYKNPIQHDPQLVKKYLTEAGYPDGKGLPVFDYELSNNSTWSRQFGEFFKSQLARVGIKVRLVINTWPQFDKKIKTKKATLFEMAWLADYPDSENFLQLFYGKNISPGPNNSNFNNPEYNKLYESALLMPLGSERTKIFRKLVNIINEEVPSMFFIHRVFMLPYHSWIENYNEYPVIFDFYQYLKVNPDKKDRMLKKL